MDNKNDYLNISQFSKQSYLNANDMNRRRSNKQILIEEGRAQSMLQQSPFVNH